LAKRQTLNKQQIVRAIGRETGLRDTDVSQVIESMIGLMTAHLVTGGRIEIQHFLVLEVQIGRRYPKDDQLPATHPITYRYLKVRPGQNLRALLNDMERGGQGS